MPKPLIGVTTFSYENLNFAFMTVGTLIIVFNIRIFQIGVHKSIHDLEKSMLIFLNTNKLFKTTKTLGLNQKDFICLVQTPLWKGNKKGFEAIK